MPPLLLIDAAFILMFFGGYRVAETCCQGWIFFMIVGARLFGVSGKTGALLLPSYIISDKERCPQGSLLLTELRAPNGQNDTGKPRGVECLGEKRATTSLQECPAVMRTPLAWRASIDFRRRAEASRRRAAGEVTNDQECAEQSEMRLNDRSC